MARPRYFTSVYDPHWKYFWQRPEQIEYCAQHLSKVGKLAGQQLRAHSNYWAAQHWNWADIMVEAKHKNLASQQLFEVWSKNESTS